MKKCGDEGTRTPDILLAKQALYQLSYVPAGVLVRRRQGRRRPSACYKGRMPPAATMPFPYPDAPRVDQIDDYFGTRVADPYRWLEDVDSPQTQAWIAEENALDRIVLATVPQRDGDPRAADGSLGLRAARRPREGRRALRVLPQYRPAESSRAVRHARPRRARARAARSQHVLARRHGRAVRRVVQRRRIAARVQRFGVGIGLAGMARARRRDGRRSARPRPLVEVLRRLVEARRQRVSTTAATTNRRPDTQVQGRELLPQAVLPPARHAAVDRRARVRAARSQGLEPRSGSRPRTAAISSLDVSRGTAPENAVFVKDLGADGPVVELLPDADARYVYLANDATTFYFLTTKDAPRGRDRRARSARPHAARDRRADSRRARRRDVLRRPHRRDVPARRARARRRLRARRARAVRGRAARPRQRRRISPASAATRETFYSYTSYTEPTSIYRYDVATEPVDARVRAADSFRRERVRERAGVLHVQGRHARPDDRHRRRRARRATAARRRFSTATADSTSRSRRRSRRRCSSGSRWAASTRSRTCAAAASTARRGIATASKRASRTSSTTSSPRRSI